MTSTTERSCRYFIPFILVILLSMTVRISASVASVDLRSRKNECGCFVTGIRLVGYAGGGLRLQVVFAKAEMVLPFAASAKDLSWVCLEHFGPLAMSTEWFS